MTISRSFCCFFLSWGFCFSSVIYAGDQPGNTDAFVEYQLPSLCPIAKTLDVNAEPVLFWQHSFDDGVQDLAMAKPSMGEALNIKRVTFGGATSQVCRYKALAITRGGEWGWHLAWSVDGTSTLNYTRMDGEAWVSSPTKKLSKNAQGARLLTILTFEQQLWVVWLETNNKMNDIYAVLSNDEGRTWQEAKHLTQTSVDIRQLKLMINEQKPYLIWDGEAKGMPLSVW